MELSQAIHPQQKKIRLFCCADIQVKNREANLFRSYDKSLRNIEHELTLCKADIYYVPGDFFEYPTPNDSERKLIYGHLARVAAIPTIKEIILFAGNHDLVKEKRQLESQADNNPIDTFMGTIDEFDISLMHKFKYLKKTGVYQSVFPQINYLAYSLEDDNHILPEQVNPDKFNICVFHDMVKEYIDEKKLPIKKERYASLYSINDFLSKLTIAGDIHEKWMQQAASGNRFYYPGSAVQRNHGEGNYLSITTNPKQKDVTSSTRYGRCFDFMLSHDEQKIYEYMVSDVALANFIAYNTITFDESALKQPIELLQEKLSGIEYGLEQTSIKVILSNLFVGHEAAIKSAIQTASMDKKRVNIEIVYSKFIMQFQDARIAEVADSIAEPGADSSNIEDADLMLDEEKLKKLFGIVLEVALEKSKAIVEADLQQETIADSIKEIFIEQLQLAMQSNSKYAVVFEGIETNNFMGLGANRIQLNIPGLTRITGTNGIGKTTLYNMIRWCVKGEVFEGMKKSQVIKNTYPIFNDKLFDTDLVLVKLDTTINDTKVVVTRTAERKWKNGTTEEHKKSKHWKRFVSGINLDVKLEVFKDVNGTVEVKTFTGDQAEKLLGIWFGNTIDTIMILNQRKIESILNMPSLELLEMVLSYIGVDYLQKLEDGLDGVKAMLNLQKPKETKDQLVEALETAGLDVNVFKGKVEKYQKDIEANKQVLEAQQKTIEAKQEALTNLGNIPDQIASHEAVVQAITAEQSNFEGVVLEKKPLLSFDELVKPEKPEASIQQHQATIEEVKKLLLCDEQSLQNIQNQYDSIFTKHTDIVATEVSTIAENKKVIAIAKGAADKKRADANTLLVARLTAIYTALISNANAARDAGKAINGEVGKLSVEIRNKNAELESGVCFNCKKPLSDNWAEHKQQLEKERDELQLKLDEQNNLYTIEEEKVAKLEEVAAKYLKYVSLAGIATTAESYADIQVNDTECLSLIESAIAAIADRDKYAAEEKLYDQKITVYSSVSGLMQKYYQAYINTSSNISIIKEINTEGSSVSPYAWVESLEVEEEFKANLRQIFNQLLYEYNTQYELYKKVRELHNTHTKEKDAVQDEIDKLNTDYNTAAEKYQKEVADRVTENQKIQAHNTAVEEQKAAQEENRIKKEQKLIEIEKLKLLLPKHTALVEELKELKEALTLAQEANEKAIKYLHEDELHLQQAKNDLKQAEEAYAKYIAYIKDKIVFDVYSSLVKREFKDIVFSYYRNFLNSTLNILLEDMNFKLLWDEENDLYMIDFKNGSCSHRPVQQSSGMETCFLGLSLIYSIHLLNVKNTVSSIFIDEISGQLNSGKNLSYRVNNYQEQLLLLLSKFTKKNIFIIDHVIDNLFETCTLEVQPSEQGSKYVVL